MPKTSQNAMTIGVDIGGTKVAAGLVDAAGRIQARTRVPMQAAGSAQAGLQAVLAAVAGVREQAGRQRIRGLGLSCPGPLDPRRGRVINPPNLPCWRNYPLVRAVERATGLPARLDNDANAAALAEARWGAGRRYRYVFYATLGTGIGAGLVLDGEIYHGRTGAAVEGGHLSLDHRGPRCGCGKHGCIEALASGPAVARRAQARVAEEPKRAARLRALAPGGPETLQAETVAAAWREGDPLATEILRETADWLGIWLGNIVDLLEPEVIVLGGGMGALMAQWFDRIREIMPAHTINSRAAEIPLRRARYGDAAGIAGGAAIA